MYKISKIPLDPHVSSPVSLLCLSANEEWLGIYCLECVFFFPITTPPLVAAKPWRATPPTNSSNNTTMSTTCPLCVVVIRRCRCRSRNAEAVAEPYCGRHIRPPPPSVTSLYSGHLKSSLSPLSTPSEPWWTGGRDPRTGVVRGHRRCRAGRARHRPRNRPHVLRAPPPPPSRPRALRALPPSRLLLLSSRLPPLSRPPPCVLPPLNRPPPPSRLPPPPPLNRPHALRVLTSMSTLPTTPSAGRRDKKERGRDFR